MANTYTQIHTQIVFAVADRQSLIHEPIRVRVEQYITGIVTGTKSKMLAIYCNPDHCHVLVGVHPGMSISDFVRTIKAQSSKWINEQQLTNARFHWQEGYGAFTYSKDDVERVIRYILNQREHHRVKTFRKEYIEFLTAEKIPFDERYIFKSVD